MSSFSSINPATGQPVWTGPAASAADVDSAVARARVAFRTWSRRPPCERETILRAFAKKLTAHKAALAEAISLEIGKPTWEALAEVASMAGKIDLSIKAHAQRCATFTGGPAITRFKPHGVVAVLGPFNFPGHLPNGHIVPALLAGNTVVFKPSEHAPLVAERTASLWRETGLPEGVLNIVQGARDTGAALAAHPGIDGLFFTGGGHAGLHLAKLFATTPEKILALELGGNNPLVVWDAADLAAAALLVVQSAYLTAGQRCTCARRLIISTGSPGDALLTAVLALLARLRVGAFTDSPEPFMGPVISGAAAEKFLAAQRDLIARGAIPLLSLRSLRPGTGLLSPGLLDVTAVRDRADQELFGPLLQVIRVATVDEALAEANATRYGLAAGLVGGDRALYDRFYTEVRAGLINWNQPLTGASGTAPFGGIGQSGNHRPGGFFAADSCSHPVASIEIPELKAPAAFPPGFDV